MEHNHHSHNHHHSTGNGMKTAFWLNASFTVLELVGGILSNSTAIITDAIHDFGDTIAIGSGVWLEKLSKKGRNPTYSYGFKRFSLLSAILLSGFLLTGSSIMLVKSALDLFSPKVVDDQLMLAMAVIGIVVNGIGFWRIYKEERNHGNNSKAVMLHLLEDVLGWVAVLIGSIVIYFTGWYWIDPLLSILIALFIISRTIPNLVASAKIFLQAVPDDVLVENIQNEILSVNGVHTIHDVHIWTMDGDYHVMSLHIVLEEKNAEKEESILQQVVSIAEKYNVKHPTVQFEANNYNCRFVDC